MSGSWGYPDSETVRVLTPEEVQEMGQGALGRMRGHLAEEDSEPGGEPMVEVRRGLFIHPRQVVAVEVVDDNHAKVHTPVASFIVPATVYSVLDRLDCQTFPLPSLGDGED